MPLPATNPARGPLKEAVAPYMADPTQKKMWEMGQQRHRDALATVPKNSEVAPVAAIDLSWHAARARSLTATKEEVRRQMDVQNKKLIEHLHSIVEKPSDTRQMIEAEPSRISKETLRDRQRRRQQKEIASENEALVKRLLAVRTTVKQGRDASSWKDHQRVVERLQKVVPANRQHRRRRERSAPRHLPQLPIPSDAAAAALAASTSTQSLPALQRSMKASQSAPLLAPITGSSPASSSRRPPAEVEATPVEDIAAGRDANPSQQERELFYHDFVASPVAEHDTLELSTGSMGLPRSPRTVENDSDEDMRLVTPLVLDCLAADSLSETGDPAAGRGSAANPVLEASDRRLLLDEPEEDDVKNTPELTEEERPTVVDVVEEAANDEPERRDEASDSIAAAAAEGSDCAQQCGGEGDVGGQKLVGETGDGR